MPLKGFRKFVSSRIRFGSKMASEAGNNEMNPLLNNYKAAMVLSGAGDALGYNRSKWEMNFVGKDIHKQLAKMGGLKEITTSMPKWIVSDDTVMHLATAEAIIKYEKENKGKVPDSFPSDEMCCMLADFYKKCMHDMADRAPGIQSQSACCKLRPNVAKGYVLEFHQRGGGCGAAMRTMCIGMYLPREDQLEKLIGLSIEAGRMTHNHPTGFLGGLCSALFASYAIQGKPIEAWGKGLLETLPKAMSYIEQVGRDVAENKQHWSYFERAWVSYLKLRNISDGISQPIFPDKFDVEERDAFYKQISFSGWGGASGHDAPMIAYDALLACNGDWEELALRGFFHGGDNDSTAAIAACWFALLYGYRSVPPCNYNKLEYRQRLEDVGHALYNIAHSCNF